MSETKMFHLLFFAFIFSVAQGRCPLNSLSLDVDPNLCYSFHSTLLKFPQAERHCQNFGAQLVSLKTDYINTYISGFANLIFDDSILFWSGGNRLKNPTEFQWPNGEKLEYKHFAANEEAKNGSCLAIDVKQGLWKPENCFADLSFICEFSIERGIIPVDADPLPIGYNDNTTYTSPQSKKTTIHTTKLPKIISEKPEIPTTPSSTAETSKVMTDPNLVIETSTESDNSDAASVESATDSQSTTPTTTEPIISGPPCPEDYILFKEYCYKQNPKVIKTWYEAEQICQSEGGHLASIHSDEENKFIKTFDLTGEEKCNHETQKWLGLLKNSISNQTWSWSDGSPVDYTKWMYGVRHKNDSCAFFAIENDCWMEDSEAGEWNDFHCNSKARYICKKRANVKRADKKEPITISSVPKPIETNVESLFCPEDYYLYENHCYKVHNGLYKKYEDACNICSKEGASLASIHSHDENLFINGLVKSYDSKCAQVWIGLWRPEGYWKWIEGSDYDYVRTIFKEYRDGDPEPLCASMEIRNDCGDGEKKIGQWAQNGCSDKKEFACKKATSKKPFTTPKPQGEEEVESNAPFYQLKGPPVCKAGWIYNNDTHYCYKLSTDMKNYADADAACRREGLSDDYGLAFIQDEKENQFVYNLAKSAFESEGQCSPFHQVWIALPQEFNNYCPGEPSNNDFNEEGCTTMTMKCHCNKGGAWNDFKCGHKFRYICKSDHQY